jgi:hypothetical protein
MNFTVMFADQSKKSCFKIKLSWLMSETVILELFIVYVENLCER